MPISFLDLPGSNPRGFTGELLNRSQCCGPPLNTALRLVSRQLNEEASDVTFSGDRFALRTSCPATLKDLLKIGEKPLSKIQHLHIELESPKWGEGITLDELKDRVLITAWREICEKLKSWIIPRRLELTFICSAADLPTARNLADTLRSLPPLKHCSLSFGSRFDRSFQTTVRDLCLELTKVETSPAHPFPFVRLPAELQLTILGYTDLVVRSKDAQFTPQVLEIEDGQLRSADLCCCIRRCGRTRCGRCSGTPVHRLCQCFGVIHSCCCYKGSNSFSTLCHCAHVSTDLLLVSRQVSSCALEVLYRQNRYQLSGDHYSSLKFLQRLPPRALDLMKDIVFKFGCWDAELGYRARREEFLSSWQDLLDFIQGNFNLSKLSLTIYSTVENASSGRGYSPQPKEDEGKVFYRDILGPVRSLKGLKAYFVYLEDDRVRHMEEESEKDVMGENYDSARFGKIATEDRQGRYI